MDNFIIKCDLVSGIFLVSGVSDFSKMPSDIVSIAVSAGLGVSVLAGLLSGVCYILTQKIQKPKRNRKSQREWYCDVCGAYLRSINGILEGDRVVTCAKCERRICKSRCSRFKETDWICKNCMNTPESWFQGILSVFQLYKSVEVPDTMNTDSFNGIDEDFEALRRKEKERIRDFIEELVNSMIGGNVDDANVSKMYNDKQYNDILSRYHQDLSNLLTDLGSSLRISHANLPVQGQTPCTAHVTLKQLIKRLIEESLSLSVLQTAQDHPAVPRNDENRTYEDLLATAIINKVVSGAQNRLANSSGASVSSRISSSSRRDDKEYFFGEETLDNKWKTTDFDTTSFSSVEDWLQNDFGSKKFVDRQTLTIKHDIEVTHTDSENEGEDDTEYFRSRSSLLGDDEPNWFLQKRHFQTASPVPVPMLVPKPTTEAKVLIGDKEIDETSDLSDIASDYGETELVPRPQSTLLESKTIIGGKNPLHSGSDGESSADSGVKEVDRDRSGYDQPDFIIKADITVDDDNVEDASILSVYSNTEKEAEYTERYASLPRTIVKLAPTPPSRPSLSKEKQNGNKTNLETCVDKPKIENNVQINEITSVNNNENTDEEYDDAETDSLFEGSYSKKEREKWKHAVEMKNNPYSKENIERRINRTRSPFDTLFGPDYYARQASLPSGGKLKDNEETELDWTANQTNGDSNDNDESWVSADSLSLKTAEEDSPIKVAISRDSTIKSKQLKSESSIELSISEVTSDSDVSYINYYDVEKSQIYKKSTEESIRKEKNEDEVSVQEISNSDFVKKKPLYNKVNSVTPLRFNKDPAIVKKRHKSESDLLSEDSFDAPPKVLSKKKDNTLISKIYSQPHVRNFALNNRKQVPGDLLSPTTPTSSIYESSRYNGKVALYNSEGEMSYERKSAFSSTEDLIEPTPKQQSFVRSSSAIINSNSQRKNSVSSEDDVLSEHSSIIGLSAKRNSKHHIYSSSDDLFSIEEQELPQKKKDNTLIDKIYQNPQVRNYGLSNRDYIPVQNNNNITTTPTKKIYSSEEDIPDIKIFTSKSENSISMENTNKQIHYGPNYGTHLAGELNFQLEKPTEEIPIRNLSTPDPEIDEIAKKKIVHSLRDKFGGSRPEITPRTKLSNDKLELNDSESEINVSVRELMKKFENKNAKSDVKSSLTARSLSKKVRDELKN